MTNDTNTEPELDAHKMKNDWHGLNEGGRWRVDVDCDIHIDGPSSGVFVEEGELREMLDAIATRKATR